MPDPERPSSSVMDPGVKAPVTFLRICRRTNVLDAVRPAAMARRWFEMVGSCLAASVSRPI